MDTTVRPKEIIYWSNFVTRRRRRRRRRRRPTTTLHLPYITSRIRIVAMFQLLSYKLQANNFSARLEYEGVSKSFRTGRLERELQMIQISATRCYFVSQSSEFCRHNPLCCFSTSDCYFVIDSVRKLSDTTSYIFIPNSTFPAPMIH